MFDFLMVGIGLVTTLFCTFAHNRTSILISAIICSIAYIIYWVQTGEMMAAYITMAAIVSLSIQLATPTNWLDRTRIYRVIFVVLLAMGVYAFTYTGPLDALPLIAFTIGRFSETFTKPVNIRTGYLVNGCIWLAFTILTQDMLATVANMIVLGGYLLRIYLDVRQTRKMALTSNNSNFMDN